MSQIASEHTNGSQPHQIAHNSNEAPPREPLKPSGYANSINFPPHKTPSSSPDLFASSADMLSHGREGDEWRIDIASSNEISVEEDAEGTFFSKKMKENPPHEAGGSSGLVLPNSLSFYRSSVSGRSSSFGALNDIKWDIDYLKALLVKTISKFESTETLQCIEKVTKLSESYRVTNSTEILEQLYEYFHNLDPIYYPKLMSAYSHMCNLANFAEWTDRVRARKVFEQEKMQDLLKPAEQSLAGTIPELLERGCSREAIFEDLCNQVVDFVMTAHPTQAVRMSMLHNYRQVGDMLLGSYRQDLTPDDNAARDEDMQRIFEILWRTDEVRRTKPTPKDEAEVILNSIEETIWEALPRTLASIDRTLTSFGMPPLPVTACPFIFSSWAGGDRDGNPFVTHDITRDVVFMNYIRGCSLFLNQLEAVLIQLPIQHASAEMVAYLTEYLQLNVLPPENISTSTTSGSRRRALSFTMDSERQPYRHLLLYLRTRLLATREYYECKLRERDIDLTLEQLRFKTVNDFKEPLLKAHTFLCAQGDCFIAGGALAQTIRQLGAFGLCLLKLDIRQEASVHTQAMDEVFQFIGMGSYSSMPENERQKVLGDILQLRRPLIPLGMPCSPPTQELFRTFSECTHLGLEPFGVYIISMCSNTSDILLVELIQREFWGMTADRPQVVPLLETIESLRQSHIILDELFSFPAYKSRLKMSYKNTQQVMLGYSDSAKDGGRIASVWELFQAQERIIEVAKRHEVKVVFFHGRGGSVGRGGGPQHLAILSQPANTINGHLRVTIQGEVITQDFGMPGMANRTLETYMSAVLKAGLAPIQVPISSPWREMLNWLSNTSMNDYKQLITSPKFIHYFRVATPEQELWRLNIGSRPSKRKEGGLESLRAIPWIFAWSQNRMQLPVWLGIGSTLQTAAKHGKMNELRIMYKQWPFFKSLFDLITMVLAKTDDQISACYDRHLVPPELTEFGQELRAYLHTTIEQIKLVTGEKNLLDNDILTQRAINVRCTWVVPCNILQIECLKKIRNGEKLADEAAVADALVISIKAIASGMQNTG